MTEPVAIVGMSVLFPGAGSLDAYWRNLVDGVDAITDVPANRWGPERYDPRGHQLTRMYCRRGGFVDEFAYFDPIAHGVMPSSVPETEPDQLLALQVAASAIEDAGGADRLPDRDRVGVILGRLGVSGVVSARFDARVRLPDQVCGLIQEMIPELPTGRLDRLRAMITECQGPYNPDDVIGLMSNLTASRIANRLNLRGTAYNLDAACASSLIAVDHGVTELLSGRLDAVLAGGVHHNHDVTFWAVFNQLKALSRRGEIRPFDVSADGVLIGEGTGVVVLKRLSDAVAAGDRIHAVIRGVGVSGDGRSASLVNPETEGQVLAVRRAWDAAGLDPTAPGALGLLEAHGTATPVGDAAELTTVAEVFGPPQGGSAPVIGSVKSMIGHSMAAAGIAGLVKAALAVSRGVLPPTLHCADPRPEMAGTRFAPIGTSRPWEQAGPRRAAVNAFGFGGINAHVVVEQAPAPARSRRRSSQPGAAGPVQVHEPEQIVLLAGPDPAAITRLLDAGDAEIRAGATTAHPGDGCRLGLVGPTAKRLATARKIVAAGAAWRDGRDIWFSPRPMLAGGAGRIAFVFPGLEAELSHRADDVAAHFGLEHAEIDENDYSGRLAGVVQLGWLLHQALARIGVTPDAVAGHSLGDWTATMVSGLIGESWLDDRADTLFSPIALRPDLSHAVIGAGAAAVEPRLPGYPGVFLTHDNAPSQSVVCGPADEVARLIQDLGQQGTVCRELPFATGVHTPYLESFVAELRTFPDPQELRSARVPIWSATIAAPMPGDSSHEHAAQRRELFFRQLVEPVRFRSTVEAMYEAGIRAFLQVGPGQLASLIHDTLRGRDHLAIPVNVESRSGLAQLRRVATALWVEGAAPDLSALGPVSKPQPAPAQPEQSARQPATGRKLRVRLELGSGPISLGDRARDLLGVPAAEASPRAGSAPAAAHPPRRYGAMGPSAVAEFAALLTDTADAAAQVLAALEHRAGAGDRAGDRPLGNDDRAWRPGGGDPAGDGNHARRPHPSTPR